MFDLTRITHYTDAKPEDVRIGDRVSIDLKDGRKFTATAYNVTEDKAFFIFDELVERRAINRNGSTKGGFEESDLCKWLNSEFKDLLPEWVNSICTDEGIFVLSLQEMFGLNEDFDECEGQLEFFKDPKNRVCNVQREEDTEWYWLRDVVSSSSFANVYRNGGCTYLNASFANIGVRPAFGISRS